jgi:hypothetical protein
MANRVVNIELHSEYCGNCAVCAGRQIGVNDERERIIKLLRGWLEDFDFDPRHLDDLVALIKANH